MAAEDYNTGDAKQNPDNNAVAVRTVFPAMAAFANQQWAVMTVDTGGYYAPYAQVESWPDLVQVPVTPTEPEEPESPEEEIPFTAPEDPEAESEA